MQLKDLDAWMGLHGFSIHLKANAVVSPPNTNGVSTVTLQPRLYMEDIYDFNPSQYPNEVGEVKQGNAKPFIVKGAIDLAQVVLKVDANGNVVSDLTPEIRVKGK